jgi:hypothetical protein
VLQGTSSGHLNWTVERINWNVVTIWLTNSTGTAMNYNAGAKQIGPARNKVDFR